MSQRFGYLHEPSAGVIKIQRRDKFILDRVVADKTEYIRRLVFIQLSQGFVLLGQVHAVIAVEWIFACVNFPCLQKASGSPT